MIKWWVVKLRNLGLAFAASQRQAVASGRRGSPPAFQIALCDSNLHGIPGMRNDAGGAAHHHAQRFKVVDQAAPPVRGPIASKLRRMLPECSILPAMPAFRLYDLPDALLPVLVYEITGHGLRRGRSRREGEDTAE